MSDEDCKFDHWAEERLKDAEKLEYRLEAVEKTLKALVVASPGFELLRAYIRDLDISARQSDYRINKDELSYRLGNIMKVLEDMETQ